MAFFSPIVSLSTALVDFSFNEPLDRICCCLARAVDLKLLKLRHGQRFACPTWTEEQSVQAKLTEMIVPYRLWRWYDNLMKLEFRGDKQIWRELV